MNGNRITPLSMKIVSIVAAIGLLLGAVIPATFHLTEADAASSNEINKENQELKEAQDLTLELVRLAKQYKHASEEDKSSLIEELDLLVKMRENALVELVRDDKDGGGAKGFLNVALPESIKEELPLEIQKHIEQDVNMEGILTVLHADNFETGESSHIYYLSGKNNNRIEVHFVDKEKDHFLHSNAQVKVHGVMIANQELAVLNEPEGLEVVSTSSQTASAAAPAAVAMTQKKVAVILFNFRDNKIELYPKDHAREVTFTGPQSVNAYFQEVSFGKIGLKSHFRTDGDVFGWYTVPYDGITHCPYGDVTGSNAAAQLAQADGFNFNNYDYVIYGFPYPDGCPGWAGWANIGFNQAWIQGYNYDLRVVSHELGHAFGLHHASSLSCTGSNGVRVSISASCYADEYGDPFDAMGGGYNGVYHFSNYHKGKLNYHDPVNLQEVTSSGTFSITPIEQSSTGVQAIRIPRGYDPAYGTFMYYYLEYRKPYGFDNFAISNPVVNGISVRMAPGYPTLLQTKLIDSTPTTFDFSDAALKVGATFTDPYNGITVKTISVDSAKATVDVQFGGSSCVRSQPEVMISPPSQWGNAGTILTYQIYITNYDSAECPSSTFSITPSLPSSSWSQTQTAAKITISPGASGMVQFSVTSPQSSVEGFYTFYETVTNIDDLAYSATTTASYNVDPRDVTPPTITAPAGVTISVSSSQPTLTNLCQNLAVSAVSANGNDGNVPANVNDNNLSTRWSNQGKGSWITLDLGQKQVVCNMDIAWYKGNERSSYFVVSASTDGTNFKAIYSSKSSGTSAQPERYEFADTVARYLKVTVNGNTVNTWASISEIDASGYAKLGLPAVSDNADPSPFVSNNAPVNGFPMGTSTVIWTAVDSAGNSADATQDVTIKQTSNPPSFSLTAPPAVTIKASGTSGTTNICQNLQVSGATAKGNDGNVPANVLDNNLSTRWSNSGTGSWITLDLGASKVVCNVDIAWYKGNERNSNFVVSVSTDGVAFKNVFTGKSSGSTVQPERYEFSDSVARFIKITVNGNNLNTWASITEIDAGGYTSLGLPAVTGSTDTSPLVYNNAPANGLPTGTTTLTWTAVDAAGNRASATQEVKVVNS